MHHNHPVVTCLCQPVTPLPDQADMSPSQPDLVEPWLVDLCPSTAVSVLPHPAVMSPSALVPVAYKAQAVTLTSPLVSQHPGQLALFICPLVPPQVVVLDLSLCLWVQLMPPLVVTSH
jgi:hypothetical protein